MAIMASVSPLRLLCYCLLFWSVSAAFTESQRADFEVRGLEDIVPAFESFEGQMYAGVLPIAHPSVEKGEEGEYMFWLFDPEAPAVDDSLIIWFNGGPGCTSFSAGLFFEMGPVTIPLRPAGTLTEPDELHAPFGPNPHGWHKASRVMYVEQPVNVGFSRGPHDPLNEDDIGRALDGFLQQFVHVFEDYQDKRIFLVGESYAGMYVPSMAHFIHERNKQRPEDEIHLNLGGIALGNGWVDAVVQGGTVIDWAWWHGLIDSVTKDDLHREWKHCLLKGKTEPAPFHPYTVPDECGMMGAVAKAAGAGLLPRGLGPNVYDMSTWDPYDLINKESTIDSFFNNHEIQKALNVPEDFDGVWLGCIPGAGRRLQERTKSRMLSQHFPEHLLDQDSPESMHDFFVDLLDDAKIPVLVYNGDRDATCNSAGTEMFLDGLHEWSGIDEWKDPESYRRGIWVSKPEDEGQATSGYSKEVKNLMFVIVYNSGHLVPYNRPVAALDLIKRLLEGESYIDKVIEPIIVDVTLPEDDDDNFKNASGRRWLATILAVIVAFAAGYFVSRFQQSKSGGYQSVPSVSR